MSEQRIKSCDALRGLAALWVVFFHLKAGGHVDDLSQLLPSAIAHSVFDLGYLGVGVFFVLSGFVMSMQAEHVLLARKGALRLLLRRLVRLTPRYYAAILCMAVYLSCKSFSIEGYLPRPDLRQLATHLVYLQEPLGEQSLNPVFWTLFIELQFYAAFFGVLAISELIFGADYRDCTILVLAVLSLAWPGEVFQWSPYSGSFLPFWYAFLAGSLTWIACRRGGRWLLAALAYALVLSCLSRISHSGFPAAAAVTAGLLLWSARARGIRALLADRRLQWLGLVSYSLYLFHNPIIGATFWVTRRWVGAGLFAQTIGASLALLLCAIIAWVAWRALEAPSIALSRRILLPCRSLVRRSLPDASGPGVDSRRERQLLQP